MRVVCQAVLFGWLTGAVSVARESRGGILGRITDPSGAAVAQAKITATNLATNTQVSSRSNAEGNYEIPYLLPGAHRVAAESAGF